jgi:hypothetical protein
LLFILVWAFLWLKTSQTHDSIESYSGEYSTVSGKVEEAIHTEKYIWGAGEKLHLKLDSGDRYILSQPQIPGYFIGDVIQFDVLVDHALVEGEYKPIKNIRLVSRDGVKIIVKKSSREEGN